MNKIIIFLTISLFSFCEASYQIKDFSYLYKKTTLLNKDLLKLHLQLYEGYVENTNKLKSLITELPKDTDPVVFGSLKRRFGFEYDGMRLHELYFEQLGNPKALIDSSGLYKNIFKSFGSFDAWKEDFVKTGLMRGIGWVVLYQDKQSGQLYNVWIHEHEGNHLAGGEPLLVMDVWEHAYITQYGLNRLSYIQNFIKEIDWNLIEKRFQAATLSKLTP